MLLLRIQHVSVHVMELFFKHCIGLKIITVTSPPDGLHLLFSLVLVDLGSRMKRKLPSICTGCVF